jgi:hypothetical protein
MASIAFFERVVFRLRVQDVQTAQDGDARVDHGGELARE